MKIAYKNILRFIEESPSIDEISEKLFQLGHENEIIGELFDIEFTPNRGDCLSVYGLARDLGVFYTFVDTLEYMNESIEPFEIDFKNSSPNDCPNISFLNIEIVDNISEYEPYLESYFKVFNINKNNFFTDVSNYVAYELGQPMHCYDYSKIDGSLEFQRIQTKFEFQTVIEKKINLSGADCIFKLNDVPINLAGIMGDKSTSCSKDTTNVLVESAYFEPESIIGKAIRYDIQSDASYKFERGVDPFLQEKALRRFIKIVSDHCEILDIRLVNQTYKQKDCKKISFELDKINKIIGINVTENLYINILENLGFKLNNNMIIVPSHRHDIESQNDLAEEIARVLGYDNIPKNKFAIDNQKNHEVDQKENHIKELLIENGFNEVINMPFSEDDNKNVISIDNPLDSNRKYLRTDLKKSLINNLLFNENRQHESIKLFEISDIYSKNTELVSEKFLGLILSGRVGDNYQDFSKKLDDQFVINLFKQDNFDIDTKFITKISRSDLNSKLKNKIYYIEIPLNIIPEIVTNSAPESSNTLEDPFTKYKKISEFPSSTRDISFSLINEELIQEIENLLLNLQLRNLKKVFVFDFYKKDNENIKIGFRFIFQAKDKTLTDKDVDHEMKKIINITIKIDGINIPGLH